MEIETIAAGAPDSGTSVDAKPETKAPVDNSGSQKDGAAESEAAAEKKWKLKFGKQERELSEKELIAQAQKGWAADERFKSAAQKERELKEAYEKADIEVLLKKLKGKDKLEYAREVLKEELKRRQMTPEELENETRKEKIERLKQEEAELEAAANKRKQEALDRHYEEKYDREMAEAWKANKMPASKYVMSRAIKIASEIVDMGLEPDWDLVTKEAKKQWQEEILHGIDSEDDLSFVGPDRARKIAKWLQAQGMNKAEAQSQAAKIVKQSDQKEPEPVDSETYWENKRKQWNK